MTTEHLKNQIGHLVRERIVEGTNPYRLPMSDELLMSCNFFDLYPPDGGGGLVSQSLIPTYDDAKYAQMILEGDALRDFGGLPNVDHRRFERWRTVEKSCWMSRFYFIVPLAKRYALTKDESLARLIVDTLMNFIDTCPGPDGKEAVLRHQRESYHIRDDYSRRTFEENQADDQDIRYIWFDFQPASRLLHFLYAAHFLKDSPSISEAEWCKIYGSMYQHAAVMYFGEHYGLELVPGNNHQSLRGLALLLGGTFFQGIGLWQEFINDGVRIMDFHSVTGFAPDGSLKENSPSYHCFQTWHVRDAAILAREYGLPLSPMVAESLIKYASFVNCVSDPSGMTVVVNDGYPVNSAAFMKSMESLNLPDLDQETQFFPDAGMAALNSDRFFVFLDASPFTGTVSHYHTGKNAITLSVDGAPFLVDSGCCGYDDELFSKWYKQPQAHSSMLVNGAGDGRSTGIYSFDAYASPECTNWQKDSDGGWRISSTLTSSVPEWKNVIWKRMIAVGISEIAVSDEVDLSVDGEVTLVFNLHPDVQVSLDGNTALLSNASVDLRLEWQSAHPFSVGTADGTCYTNFDHHESKRILVKLIGNQGKAILNTTFTPAT